MKNRIREYILARVLYSMIILALLSPFSPTVSVWSNGGCSSDPSVPDYGTHDWIAGHALDFLPQNEKGFIENNLTEYFYGTELPDCPSVPGGIGDQEKHHVYYRSNGQLQDDSAAVRAQAFYQDAAVALVLRNFQQAARSAGVMSHYLSNLAVFGHVMDDSTDWGEEIHQSDYEDHVNTLTNNYDDEFNGFLKFDQSLESRTAYNATLTLAYDTTFDTFEGRRPASWMDDDRNYSWDNSDFRNRAGQSMNLAVNLLADVLHTLSQQNPSGSAAQPVSYSTLPYIILAVALAFVVVVVVYRGRKKK